MASKMDPSAFKFKRVAPVSPEEALRFVEGGMTRSVGADLPAKLPDLPPSPSMPPSVLESEMKPAARSKTTVVQSTDVPSMTQQREPQGASDRIGTEPASRQGHQPASLSAGESADGAALSAYETGQTSGRLDDSEPARLPVEEEQSLHSTEAVQPASLSVAQPVYRGSAQPASLSAGETSEREGLMNETSDVQPAGLRARVQVATAPKPKRGSKSKRSVYERADGRLLRKVTVYMPEQLAVRLKTLAVREGDDVSAILCALTEKYLAKKACG